MRVSSTQAALCQCFGSPYKVPHCAGGDTEEEEQQPPAAKRQALLVTLGTLASTSGVQHAKPLLACFPAVLHLVKQEPRQAVRGSATACVAALVAGLATAALPALPKLVPALLDAAERSIKALTAPAQSPQDQDMADASSGESDEVGICPLALCGLILALDIDLLQNTWAQRSFLLL